MILLYNFEGILGMILFSHLFQVLDFFPEKLKGCFHQTRYWFELVWVTWKYDHKALNSIHEVFWYEF